MDTSITLGFSICIGAAIYGRRVGATYAPGYISDFLIRRTILFMGSETLGKITGATIIAPMFTPDLIPMAVVGAERRFSNVLYCRCNRQYDPPYLYSFQIKATRQPQSQQ